VRDLTFGRVLVGVEPDPHDLCTGLLPGASKKTLASLSSFDRDRCGQVLDCLQLFFYADQIAGVRQRSNKQWAGVSRLRTNQISKLEFNIKLLG